jgi:predicted DsbA family dithiol-disulfide isomerase
MPEGKDKTVRIEMFYTLMCPNCRTLSNMLKEVLPQFGDRYKFGRTLANGPRGMVRSMKLGIHAVPALLIDGRIVFRGVPSKKELIDELNKHSDNGRKEKT